MNDQTTPRAWARVHNAIQRSHSKILRRGAWYPIVRDEMPDRVTIVMDGRPMEVPRRILEIRKHRPTHFSVVNRVEYNRRPNRKSQHNLGKEYAVCPKCAYRFPLWGQPTRKTCPSCGHEGEVGWWEE